MVTVTITDTAWLSGKVLALRVYNPNDTTNATVLMTEGGAVDSVSSLYSYSGSLTMADNASPYKAEIRDITDQSGTTAQKFDAASSEDLIVVEKDILGTVTGQVLVEPEGGSTTDLPPVADGEKFYLSGNGTLKPTTASLGQTWQQYREASPEDD